MRKNQRETFRSQFEGMPFEPFTYDDHRATLERLVSALRQAFTDDDRAFLISFEAGDPDWSRFPIAMLAELPAPQFKLINIRKFREASPERHKAVLNALEESLT